MAIRIEDALSFPFRLPVGSLLRQIAIVSKEFIYSSCNETNCMTNNVTSLIGGYAGDSEDLSIEIKTTDFQLFA